MTFGATITCIMIVMMAISDDLIRQVDDGTKLHQILHRLEN
jgi:hypothetical protein